jgi:hypothetical protein
VFCTDAAALPAPSLRFDLVRESLYPCFTCDLIGQSFSLESSLKDNPCPLTSNDIAVVILALTLAIIAPPNFLKLSTPLISSFQGELLVIGASSPVNQAYLERD